MPKAVMLRVAEWGAWLPLEKDHAEPRLQSAQGMTGFQIDDGEKLVDLDVMPVMQRESHFPVTDSEGQVRNVKHRLHVFRVTLASEPKEIPEEQLDSGHTAEGKGGGIIFNPNHDNPS